MRLIASGMGGFDTCDPFDAAFDNALVGEVSGLAALLVDVVGGVAGFGVLVTPGGGAFVETVG